MLWEHSTSKRLPLIKTRTRMFRRNIGKDVFGNKSVRANWNYDVKSPLQSYWQYVTSLHSLPLPGINETRWGLLIDFIKINYLWGDNSFQFLHPPCYFPEKRMLKEVLIASRECLKTRHVVTQFSRQSSTFIPISLFVHKTNHLSILHFTS